MKKRGFSRFKGVLLRVGCGLEMIKSGKPIEEVAAKYAPKREEPKFTPVEYFLGDVDKVIAADPRTFPNPNVFPKIGKLQEDLKTHFAKFPRPAKTASSAKLDSELEAMQKRLGLI